MAATGEIHFNADTNIVLSNLKNTKTGEYDTGATVSAILWDEDAEPEEQIGTTIQMPYVVGTVASYLGEIADTLAIAWKKRVRVEVTATRLTLKGFWTIKAVCVKAPSQ